MTAAIDEQPTVEPAPHRAAQAVQSMPDVRPAPGLPHRAWVAQIMGMPISVHLRGARARDEVAAAAVADLFDDLRGVEARFSPFRRGLRAVPPAAR